MPVENCNNLPVILKEFTVGDQKFWIQTVEERYVDELANAMVYDYVQEEPLGRFAKAYNDPEYRLKSEIAYNSVLRKEFSIVCLTLNEEGKPTIAGVQCLDVIPYAEVKDEYMFGHSYIWYMLQFNNVCVECNVKKYLVDKGLYVLPDFRRKGIGRELLKCWSLLCKQLNIKLCLGSFSSKYSQLAAERAGLKKIKYLPYDEMRKVFPNEIPIGIETHTEGIALYCAYA